MVNLTNLQMTAKIVAAAGHVTLKFVAWRSMPNCYFQFYNFFSAHVRIHFAFKTAVAVLVAIGHHDGRLPPNKTKIFGGKNLVGGFRTPQWPITANQDKNIL